MKLVKKVLYYLFLIWLALLVVSFVAVNYTYNTNLPIIIPISLMILYFVTMVWGLIETFSGNKDKKLIKLITIIIVFGLNIVNSAFIFNFRYVATDDLNSALPQLIRSMWGLIPIVYYVFKYRDLNFKKQIKKNKWFVISSIILTVAYIVIISLTNFI